MLRKSELEEENEAEKQGLGVEMGRNDEMEMVEIAIFVYFQDFVESVAFLKMGLRLGESFCFGF